MPSKVLSATFCSTQSTDSGRSTFITWTLCATAFTSSRSFAQKDPLQEYKTEAYELFEALMNNIRGEVLHNLFRSTTNLRAFEEMLAGLPRQYAGGGSEDDVDQPPAPPRRQAPPPLQQRPAIQMGGGGTITLSGGFVPKPKPKTAGRRRQRPGPHRRLRAGTSTVLQTMTLRFLLLALAAAIPCPAQEKAAEPAKPAEGHAHEPGAAPASGLKRNSSRASRRRISSNSARKKRP